MVEVHFLCYKAVNSCPGSDVLKTLGFHEGEGLLLENLAGSKSTFIKNKGQKVRQGVKCVKCSLLLLASKH